jgi:LysM repeat protein
MRSFVSRVSALSVVVAFGAACGGGSSSQPTTTPVSVNSTNWVTQPTTPVTAPPTTGVPQAGEVVAEEQQHTVVFGDFLFGIAKTYGTTADAIAVYNEWEDGINHPLNPGDIVRIPPGSLAPGATPVTPVTSATPAPIPATTIAGGVSTCGTQGSYTIAEGDYPGLVASKFDVSVAQLEAANAATNGYSAFYVGLKIVIPAKDC